MKKIASLLILISLFGCGKSEVVAKNELIESAASLSELNTDDVNPIQLEGEFSEIFMLGSDYTDLQREKTANKVVGTNVIWDLPVYEVSLTDGVYKVVTQSGLMTGDANRKLLNATVFIYPQNDDDRQTMDALKTNDTISFKGRVVDVRLRSLVIVNPAILVKRDNISRPEPKLGSEKKRANVRTEAKLRWTEIGNYDQLEVTTYIDKSSKRKSNNIGKIWRMDNYSESHESKEDFRSSTYLSEFNCDDEQTRVTSDNYFSGAMGTGTPVNVNNEPTPWVPVAPNTVGALVMKIACET
jgi:hypothetical protein